MDMLMISDSTDSWALVAKIKKHKFNREFIIIPTITYGKHSNINLKGHSLSLRWGIWGLLFGIVKTI